ncbi:hypothetical protein [Tengunoibacter tsumagoiensis]|uniref:Uncharacterized protein n=1 Tax=Tengunoibacter tsumagoiensis TaxID=2014871 RepID=A0A402A4V3_9CHLR|nr:hypothetical protein [Tengunoibacter tsumagoiensis]GCE14187.1 hypothetical protein KTT_40460 [Tengunoibacter tsumagoiensis]GCE14241.1 hypothetical protein KTT_41000 [Tengunoibacter tsumagoiensis]
MITTQAKEKSTPPLLNRAQRRAGWRYVARKARAKISSSQRQAMKASQKLHCKECGFAFLGSSNRCQCKASIKHQSGDPLYA